MTDGKVLEMRSIFKQFPGVIAVNNVDFELERGEVVGLLGENGAGKSTLIKILSGVYQADEGEVIIDGEKLGKYHPKDTLKLGVAVIYQELNYLNDMSIAENIYLGHYPTKKGLKQIDYKKLESDSLRIQKEVGLDYLSPAASVRDLSVAEKQLLEIARAYSHNVKILVMDEPTSALNESETQILFKLIHKLKKAGISVIYISHKLEEIQQITDRVYIMRDGSTAYNGPTTSLSKSDIIHYMVGREIKEMYPVTPRELGDTVLEISGLNTKYLKDINFEVKSGEIVGLFGLMGSGTDDIVKCIFGIQKADSLDLKIDNKSTKINSPSDAIKNRIAYVPSERKTEGLILNHSVKQNATITALNLIKKGLRLNLKKENELVNEWVKKLNVKTPSIETQIDSLSGGNQQKVVLAKWLLLNPKVLVMNEPTKGIDVGAKVEIYKLMEYLCNNKLGVVMVSSEMPEMLGIADKIVVVNEGRITSVFKKNEADQAELMRSAIGG